MSDGPRDAKRLGLPSTREQFRATYPLPPSGPRAELQGSTDRLSITKADASRILSRYAPLHIEDLSENELDLVLKLKRFSGE